MAYRRRLTECWERLVWAKVHRNKLKAELASVETDESKRVPIVAKFDVDAFEYSIQVIELPRRLIARVGLRIGDTIHNLRSALDLLAWQLACEATGSKRPPRPRQIQFPIYDFAKTTDVVVGRRKVKRWGFDSAWLLSLAPQQKTALAGFQPYRGGHGKHLRLLRDMSNDDKHRLLTPILLTGVQDFTTFWLNNGMVTSIQVFENRRLKPGVEVARFGWRAYTMFDPKDQVTSTLTPYIGLRNRRDPVETLDHIAAAVTKVLETFDP